ncbi:MAG TPA: hypothetical protein VME24_11225 [Alphaproteobacteria bacterium]|nr:hypothetical protein [Alphaproteobacteria bacterium]
MKTYYLIPLLFLSACSTTPKLTLRPQQFPPATDNSTVRYPEVINAYHVGRYVDPNDDLVMHERHVVYRVEENTHWNFHPGAVDGNMPALPPVRDAAFNPLPVNDAVLAEVNAQKLATIEIMMEARTLSGALAQFQAALQQTRTNLQETAVLRAAVIEMKKQLDALETAQAQIQPPPISPTNEPPDSLGP